MSRRGLAWALIVAALGAAAVAFLVLRPPARATATGGGATNVAVECAAGAGLDDARCATWASERLAAGAPSYTFDMKDLGRLVLRRDLYGFGSSCQAVYYTTRNVDDPAWTEDVACP